MAIAVALYAKGEHEKASKFVVAIATDFGHGSGFIVSPDGLLVILAPMLTYFGSEVPRLSFTSQPEINGVAEDS